MEEKTVDYRYLRCDKRVLQEWDQEEWYEIEGGRRIRKRFWGVELYKEEEERIAEVEKMIQSVTHQRPQWWCNRDTLIFIYANDFDLEKTSDMIHEHWKWLRNMAGFELNHKTIAYIKVSS